MRVNGTPKLCQTTKPFWRTQPFVRVGFDRALKRRSKYFQNGVVLSRRPMDPVSKRYPACDYGRHQSQMGRTLDGQFKYARQKMAVVHF